MKEADKKKLIRTVVARHTAAACRVSDTIADYAELGLQEFKSSCALADFLRERGFEVEFPWRSMPTAFRAVRGRGRPCIGLLAEYDALADCGLQPGTPGHGCGHNLLGTASALAAVAATEALAKRKLPGRIVLWGCPAEELLNGKVYMARDGAFRNHDAILAWHPEVGNRVRHVGGAAMDSVTYEFFGKTAHGAYADSGRSALDGVMLLDVAANYLREHVPENVRIHMCVPHGGDAPNVVPGYACGWYFVRGRDRAQVEAIRRRLDACARGAAMATETRVKVTRLTGVYNRLPNKTISRQMLDNFKLFGAPRVTEADRRHVRALGDSADFNTKLQSDLNETPSYASSDEANVSWLAPMSVIGVACKSRNAAGHHRDTTAQGKLPFAHRGLCRAAEILAATALDLCRDAGFRRRAKSEFRGLTRDFVYDPLVPKRQKILGGRPERPRNAS